ncbi:MAG: GNAT family N-acetyltransferase [Ferruginibacter sp.]
MIRIATVTDRHFVYSMYMHPQVNRFLLYEPMDEQEFEPIYKDLLEKKTKFIYTDNGVPLGMFKLIPLTHRTSHIAYLGGVAIHPDQKGRGHGKKMMEEIIDLAGSRGFLRIELSVADINTTAINLYERTGFQKEGVLRKYSFLKKEERFMDELLMAYLY